MRNPLSWTWKGVPVLFAGLLLVGMIFATTTTASAAVSFDFFYSNLRPYGHWLVSGSYGRVWQPGIYRSGWNPYYDGEWIYTDLGWTWESDYSWGDIPYHYGTWAFDPGFGWVWVPGNVWAPSWVVFREGPDYIGWAPAPPNFSIGVGFAFGDIPTSRFVFVPCNRFVGVRVRQVMVAPARTSVIINRTRIVTNSIRVENNVVVNRGPSVERIQQALGRPIRPVPVEQTRVLKRLGREDFRIDPQKAHGGVKAAEIVSPRPEVKRRSPVAERRPPIVSENRPVMEQRRVPNRESVEQGRIARNPQSAQRVPEGGQVAGARQHQKQKHDQKKQSKAD